MIALKKNLKNVLFYVLIVIENCTTKIRGRERNGSVLVFQTSSVGSNPAARAKHTERRAMDQHLVTTAQLIFMFVCGWAVGILSGFALAYLNLPQH